MSEERRKLAELAGKHTPQALKTLADIAAKGESEAARVSAATALLDRAFGRPAQSHELAGADGGAIVIHLDSVDAAA